MSHPHLAEVRAALEEIVRGRDVRRLRHELQVGGMDYTDAFREILVRHGYRPLRVREVEVAADERAPAFLVEPGWATFGHVFWEKFTQTKRRKLFGSVLRDAKGDWAVILGVNSAVEVYVDPARREKVDPDRPV